MSVMHVASSSAVCGIPSRISLAAGSSSRIACSTQRFQRGSVRTLSHSLGGISIFDSIRVAQRS